MVKEVWQDKIQGNPLIVMQQMKKLRKVLIAWSRSTYEDIFKKITALDDIVRMKEIQLEVNPSENNKRELSKVEEDHRKYYQVEKELSK